ncbi:winged helix-turn-helix transcriptional regulator [Limisalsivibrio acetivorans]|uniref:winged helix-turn-helix transcriptional regulator n=1 Tax=Limisalsivibrio acetivorans TaxID=1304888 RepID=UPI0003B61699|nr:helix-turn-helix domain-containing protein [Limisalsivibrio acetivorans]
MEQGCVNKSHKNRVYKCHFQLALMVIGGKWKPIILYYLGKGGVMRFGELRRAIGGITEKMLVSQLRELEEDGLVHREIYREVPPKVEYSLTEFGMTLIPILDSLHEWGISYEKETKLAEDGDNGREAG